MVNNKRNNSSGFTLVELLIVIAIIAIIAVIAIPNLLSALQKGRQKTTMGDMSSIGKAVESYLADNTVAPSGTMEEINPILQPFFLKRLPKDDGWGNVFQYTSEWDIYSIGSGGRDNSVVDWSQFGEYVCMSITDYLNDIIYSGGQFVYFPRIK